MVYASKRSLDAGFQELLDRDSSVGLTLWISVERNLTQFHLSGYYTEAFIINEVYLRAANYIDQGGTIDNLIAWCRATAYNVVREQRRRDCRYHSYDHNPLDLELLQAQPVLLNTAEISEEYEIIRRAFALLSPTDQQLIHLSVVNGLSWREIHTCLVAQGQSDRNEAALRKAKERAIRRLRENYHEIKLPQV
jgi:DNA-directed RNA polymerase specialized sigma24 family protein